MPKTAPISPYLAGNFGPIEAEHADVPLPVLFGAIPPALAGGQFVRNGPNAAAQPRSTMHWFVSEGSESGSY